MLIREWTEEEERFLIENYSKFGSEYCSEKLSRTIGGIRTRAKKLKIKWERVKRLYHKEFLEELVKESMSIGMVLDKMNLRKAGGNYRVINKYISKYDIDITHFINGEFKIGSNPKNKLDLKEILVDNSSYDRKNLKKRLYDENILEKKCCLCGQDENWNDMKISLILDHINGVHNDNRIENLRIVCPNCNAGLDTFAGKNNKREKKEKIKEIKKQENTNSRRKVERPPIEQLIKEIDEIGYSATGRKYGVSDNAIRKWIKKK
jgi:5-methylcytosine-specific restriction endonuclease McrA